MIETGAAGVAAGKTLIAAILTKKFLGGALPFFLVAANGKGQVIHWTRIIEVAPIFVSIITGWVTLQNSQEEIKRNQVRIEENQTRIEADLKGELRDLKLEIAGIKHDFYPPRFGEKEATFMGPVISAGKKNGQ